MPFQANSYANEQRVYANYAPTSVALLTWVHPDSNFRLIAAFNSGFVGILAGLGRDMQMSNAFMQMMTPVHSAAFLILMKTNSIDVNWMGGRKWTEDSKLVNLLLNFCHFHFRLPFKWLPVPYRKWIGSSSRIHIISLNFHDRITLNFVGLLLNYYRFNWWEFGSGFKKVRNESMEIRNVPVSVLFFFFFFFFFFFG